MTAFRQGSFSFRGIISGFVPSISGGDTDHDVIVSAGAARSDDSTATLEASTAITKQIDANWAEGNNQGGFPSGLTLTADTWYQYFAIRRTSDGNVDYGFDVSPSATNLLADATDYSTPRYIGSILTDSISNIVAFTATEVNGGGLWIQWDAPGFLEALNVGTTAVLRTLQTPLGKRTLANLNVYNFGTIDDGTHLISSPDVPDLAPSITVSPLGTISGNVTGGGTSEARMLPMQVLTNLSSQIRSRDNNATADLRIVTTGYTDFRTV